jgi:hypothetical protein
MTLTAILIILLILPGFIFSLACYNSDNIALPVSLTHKTIASLTITVILHAIGISFISHLGISINFAEILNLLNGNNPNITLSNISILHTLYYFGILYGTAYAIGLLFRHFIKKHDLEHFKFFRLSNIFHLKNHNYLGFQNYELLTQPGH